MTEKTPRKICTHCGAVLWNRRTGRPVKELYDEDLFSKSKILRLLDCKNCCGHHGVVDVYVEQEGVVVLIDLVLQTRQAYRHVLYNGDYAKLILKMALLAIICDGYIDWASLPNAGEFFEQEYLFYAMCGKVTLALGSYIIVVMILCRPSLGNVATTVIGLLMAYSARFCYLAAALWAPQTLRNEDNGSKEGEHGGINGGSEFMWYLVYGLFFLATVRVIQVTQNRPLLVSALVAVVSHAVFNGVHHVDWVLNPASC